VMTSRLTHATKAGTASRTAATQPSGGSCSPGASVHGSVGAAVEWPMMDDCGPVCVGSGGGASPGAVHRMEETVHCWSVLVPSDTARNADADTGSSAAFADVTAMLLPCCTCAATAPVFKLMIFVVPSSVFANTA
jgi:hypothetical protein